MNKKIKLRWLLAYIISHIFVKYILRNELTYNENSKVDVSKPFVLLGNHSCFYDFLFAIDAIGPYPVKFVVAAKYFSNPIVGFFLKFYGAIPKKLAEKDFECMRRIISSINKGESIAIYPEGRVSMWGTTEYISPSTAKLVKRFSCNLVMVQNLGSFFVSPPYGGTKKFGKTYTKVHVYDSNMIANMSADKVNEVIHEVLSVNQYDWYHNKKRKFFGIEKVSALANLIYRCPSCNKITTMEHKLNKLVCRECDLEGVIKDCHFRWNKQNIPNSISELYTRFKEFERKSMIDNNWKIETECTIEIMDLSLGKQNVFKKSTVLMDLNVIQLNFNDQTLIIKHKLIDYFPFDVGSNFQIYQNGKLYIIKPYNKSLATAFSVMHEATKDYNEYLIEEKIAN